VFSRSGNPVEQRDHDANLGCENASRASVQYERITVPACGMQFVLTREVHELIVTIATDAAAIPRHIETRFEGY
jgi:hypothetical protein